MRRWRPSGLSAAHPQKGQSGLLKEGFNSGRTGGWRRGMRRLHPRLKWRGLFFFRVVVVVVVMGGGVFLPLTPPSSSFPSLAPLSPSSLNYANASDVWSCLRHSVLLVVLLRYWVPLQWMHTTKSPPLKAEWSSKRWKDKKGPKLGDFLCTLKRRIKYKFPIGACYGSGSHIKALCYGIKAFPHSLPLFLLLAHHMWRRRSRSRRRRKWGII